MRRPFSTIGSAFLAALSLTVPSACSSTRYLSRSEVTELRGVANAKREHAISGFTHFSFDGVQIGFDPSNDVGTASEAHVLGIRTQEDQFGITGALERPFSVVIILLADSQVLLEVAEPMLRFAEKSHVGSAYVPAPSERDKYFSCDRKNTDTLVRVIDALPFEPVRTAKGELEYTCIRVVFDIDPPPPETSFRIEFGSIRVAGKTIPLDAKFENVQVKIEQNY